jgi:hypothetical protein
MQITIDITKLNSIITKIVEDVHEAEWRFDETENFKSQLSQLLEKSFEDTFGFTTLKPKSISKLNDTKVASKGETTTTAKPSSKESTTTVKPSSKESTTTAKPSSKLDINVIDKWHKELTAKEFRDKAIEMGIKLAAKCTKQQIYEKMVQSLENTTNTTCLYIQTRHPNKGQVCNTTTKPNEAFCSKHLSTQQALEYKATNGFETVKQITSTNLSKAKIYRDSELKVWVVDGTKLIVENPNNRKLVAYITEDNTVERNITRKHKEEAQELGLIVE